MLFLVITLLSASNFFFWDTINLVAAPAHFFYETNFSILVLPNNIDTGHIPSLGFYLALIWKFFGKSLLISHLAMLPFVFGIIYQLQKLISTFIVNPLFQFLALLLILTDASFLSQSILISPDIVLLFFFFLGLNAVIKNKKNLLTLAIIGLFLISLRGTITAFALLIIDVVIINKTTSTFSIKLILKRIFSIYAFPFIVLVGFHYYHYITTGWIATHENSPWRTGNQINNFSGMLFNTGLFIWRIMDFGRLFIIIVFIFLVFKSKNTITSNLSSKKIMGICFVLLALLSLPFFIYKSQTQHRYLLPFLMLFILLVSHLITNFNASSKTKTIFFILLSLFSLAGNLWVYPNKIAQGWDSTLGHIPFYSHQYKMNDYLNKNNIPFESVGSAFPIVGKHSVIFLNDDTRSFKPKNVGKDHYILYSNVFNDFSDNELTTLQTDYTLVYQLHSPTVFLQLFQHK